MPGKARLKVSDSEKKSYKFRQERWAQKRKLRNEAISKLAETQTKEATQPETQAQTQNQSKPVTRSFSSLRFRNRESSQLEKSLIELSLRVTALETELTQLKNQLINSTETSSVDEGDNQIEPTETIVTEEKDLPEETNPPTIIVTSPNESSQSDSDEEFVLEGTEIEVTKKSPRVEVVKELSNEDAPVEEPVVKHTLMPPVDDLPLKVV